MAQKTVKKGFFFYFGLFVLLLIAVFMCCLVVMMFNPGKTVLWMKYFTASEDISVTKASGETINFDEIRSLSVKCGYADVVVECNKAYSKSGLHIINNAKGFAVAKGSKTFGYTVTKVGSQLNLEITEPTGFLFFSKNIKVVLNSHENWVYGNNFKLTVDADGDSDVYIGGSSLKNEKKVEVAALDVKTAKGDIVFRADTCDTTKLTGGVSAVTEKGTIKVGTTTATTDSSFKANSDVHFETTSGKIRFGTINIGSNNMTIKNVKGAVVIDSLTATNTSVTCKQGNFVFGNVFGKLDFSAGIDQIISPNIIVDSIIGDFTLSTTEAEVSPEISIGAITGKITVNADSGKLNVKEANGEVSITSMGSLTENVTLGASNTSRIGIVNTKGAITLGFKGAVSNDVELTNGSGKITLNFTTAAHFHAVVTGDASVTLSIDKDEMDYTEGNVKDIVIGSTGSTGNVAITSDGKVSYNLVERV
ncbi:MAG: hypothetical protein IJ817_03995 [Clostridia bacterium]|nr:hypothetical protein [Clostridia bacterium]